MKRHIILSAAAASFVYVAAAFAQDIDFNDGAETVDPFTQPFGDWAVIIIVVAAIIIFISLIGYAILKSDIKWE